MKSRVKLYVISGILLFAALVLLGSSVYTVREDEVAVIHRFGRIERVVINPGDLDAVNKGFESRGLSVRINTMKGLNFKIPFVEDVQKYSSKYLTYTSTRDTINTLDSRRIDLSMYAQYRIVNPALFSMTIGTQNNSIKLMDDRVYPVVIQTANTLNFNEFFDHTKITAALDVKREELNDILTSQFGVSIIDIGIYRKNFPQANIASIEEKMTQEIQKESEKLMAEGDSLLRQSKAETDRLRKETVARAVEESAAIKAEADAEAMGILEEALKVDIEFYRFITRMESYRSLRNTTVFLDQSNDFIEYLNQQ